MTDAPSPTGGDESDPHPDMTVAAWTVLTKRQVISPTYGAIEAVIECLKAAWSVDPAQAREDALRAEVERVKVERDTLREALTIANAAKRKAEDRATEAEHAAEPLLRELTFKDGVMTAAVAGPIVEHLALAMTTNFRASGATNYIEMGLNARSEPFERFVVTVQKYGAKSPHMLRQEAEALAAERAVELNARDRLIALLRTDIQKGLGQVDPTICDGCGAPIYADENQAGGDVRGCWGYVAEGGPPSPCYRYRTETGADRSWPPCAALAASGGGGDA